jgi:hypothetical protein
MSSQGILWENVLRLVDFIRTVLCSCIASESQKQQPEEPQTDGKSMQHLPQQDFSENGSVSTDPQFF